MFDIVNIIEGDEPVKNQYSDEKNPGSAPVKILVSQFSEPLFLLLDTSYLYHYTSKNKIYRCINSGPGREIKFTAAAK
jgi:hypothetical protein